MSRPNRFAHLFQQAQGEAPGAARPPARSENRFQSLFRPSLSSTVAPPLSPGPHVPLLPVDPRREPLNVPLHSAPPPAPLETPPLSKTLELPRDPDGFPYDLSRSVLTLPDPASGEWMQASEYTETVSGDEIGGRPGFFYNIPTIWDGGIRSSEESRRRAHKRLQAGWEFPSYRTLGDAVAGARRRSLATPLERMHQPSALTQERVGEVRSRLNLRPEPGSQPVPSEPGYAKAEGRDFGQAVEHGAYSLQASLDRYMGDAAKARYLEEREWMEANPGTMWSKPWDERTEHEQYRTWNHAGRHGFRPLTAQEQEEGVLPFDEGLQHRYAEAERMESLARDTAFRPMNFDEVENLSDFLLYGKTAVGSSLPATAVGMVSGGVLSPFLLTAEVNDHLREIPDLPLDTRLRYAKTGGAIAGALEVVGLRVLALGIPHELLGRLGVPAIHAHIEKNLSSRLAGRFLTSAAAEGLTELGQEDTFIQTEQLAGKEFQPGEKAFRRREALLQGALAGGPMGTAMAAPKAVAQEAGLVEPDPLPPDPEHELAMQQAWEGIRRQLQLEVSLDSSAPSLTETLVEPVPGMELEGVPESMKEPESEVDAVDIAGALRSLTEPPTAEVEPVPFEATSLVEAFQPVAEPEPEPVAESEPDPEPVVHDAPALAEMFQIEDTSEPPPEFAPESTPESVLRMYESLQEDKFRKMDFETYKREYLATLKNYFKYAQVKDDQHRASVKGRKRYVPPPTDGFILNEWSERLGMMSEVHPQWAEQLDEEFSRSHDPEEGPTPADPSAPEFRIDEVREDPEVQALVKQLLDAEVREFKTQGARKSQLTKITKKLNAKLETLAPKGTSVWQIAKTLREEARGEKEPEIKLQPPKEETAEPVPLPQDAVPPPVAVAPPVIPVPPVKPEIEPLEPPLAVMEPNPDAKAGEPGFHRDSVEVPVFQESETVTVFKEVKKGGGQRFERQELPVSGGVAKERAISTVDGGDLEVEPVLVERTELKQATGDLQPRFTREAQTQESEQEARKRALAFDPRQLLEQSPIADSGPPVVLPDGTILSGNGRKLTMDLVYGDSNFADRRESYLTALGHPEGFREPILVFRVKPQSVTDRKQLSDFAVGANKPRIQALAATETAKVDSSKIREHFSLYGGGSLLTRDNASFVKAFIGSAGLENDPEIFADGQLTQKGEARIQSAILWAAYGEDSAREMSKMLESTNDEIKSIHAMMETVAPDFVRLKIGIDAQEINPEMDITQSLVAAAQLVRQYRMQNKDIETHFAQTSFLDTSDPVRDNLIRAWYRKDPKGPMKPRSKAHLQKLMRYYVQEAQRQQVNTLFAGDELGPSKTAPEIIKEGDARLTENTENQGTFGGLANSGVGRTGAGTEAVRKQRKRSGRTGAGQRDRGRAEADQLNEPKSKPGSRLVREMQTPRQSVYRQAYHDAFEQGITEKSPDLMENSSPEEKFKVLSALARQTFGFRDIRKGRDAKAPIDNLLDAHRNLQFMANVLGLPARAMGLEGRMALMLPSKVRANYNAAYFPGSAPVVIASDLDPALFQAPAMIMPKRANSFAHEWGHALDYHLMERFGAKGGHGITAVIRNVKLKERPWLDGTPEDVQTAFAHVMNAIYFDQAEFAAKLMQVEQEIARLEQQETLRRGQGRFKGMKGEGLSPAEIKRLEKARDQHRRMMQEGSSHTKGESAYRRSVKRFGEMEGNAKYWLKPTEMFARAFESYVAHQVVRHKDATTEFITKAEDAYRLPLKEAIGADIRLPLTHPQNTERESVFQAFHNLFAALQKEALFEGEVSSAPGTYAVVDFTEHLHDDVGWHPFDKKALEDSRKAEQATRIQAERQASRPFPFSDRSAWERGKIAADDRFALPLLFSKRVTLFHLSNRYRANKQVHRVMEELISMLATDPGGERVTAKGGTFEEATGRQVRRFSKAFKSILDKSQFQVLDSESLDRVRLLMTSDPDTHRDLIRGKGFQRQGKLSVDRKGKTKFLKEDTAEVLEISTPGILKSAAEFRQAILEPVFHYLKDAGVDINFLSENAYLPRMLDTVLVLADENKFLTGGKVPKRGAVPMYREVLWLEEFGVYEGSQEQVQALAKMARSSRFQEFWGLQGSEDPVSTLIKKAQELAGIRSKIGFLEEGEDPDAEVKIAALEEQAEQILEENAEAFQTAHDQIADQWAEMGARDWLYRIRIDASDDPSAHSPMGRFTKSRVFPKEADTYMSGFYLEAIESIQKYVVSAVRKAEFERRFGAHKVPAGKKKGVHGNLRTYLDYLYEERLAQEGMAPSDIKQLRQTIEFITGTQAPGFDPSLQTFLNWFHAVGTMTLLPKAVYTSIAEPFTTGIQSGSVSDGMKSFVLTLEEAFAATGNQTARERVLFRRHLAHVLGIVDDLYMGELMSNRLGGSFADDPKAARQLSTFFRRTGLQGITNAQRRSSMSIGMSFFNSISEMYQNGVSKPYVTRVLEDYGIPAEQADLFTKNVVEHLELSGQGSMPTVRQLLEADGKLTEFGEQYAVAVGRFVDHSIQDPKKVDRPRYAEHPLGRIVFGITSFSRGFHRNVLTASVNRSRREFKHRGKLDAAKYTAEQIAAPLMGLFLSHLIVNTMRVALFDHDRWEEEKKKGVGDLASYLLESSLYRAGFAGAFDPLVQSVRSVKYQKDFANIFIGAAPSYFASAGEDLIRFFTTNSERTVSAEFQAVKSLYEVILLPLVVMSVANPRFGFKTLSKVPPTLRGPIGGATAQAASTSTMKNYVSNKAVEGIWGETYKAKRSGGRRK